VKILVLLSRVPYPLEKGDKLRAYNQIKELSKKHEIILVAINDTHLDSKAVEELKKFCKEIYIIPLTKTQVIFNLIKSVFSELPFQVGYFYFKKAQKVIDEIILKHQPDHIYCQLIRTAEYAKKHPVKKTLDYMDVFSKGMQRRKQSSNILMRPIIGMEENRLLKYESEIFNAFDNKTIISDQDKSFIQHPEKEKITVIPNGVDFNFFKPFPIKKEFDLLFNGNMNYPPNIESVEYLVKKILPIIHKTKPEVNLLISGASPAAKVLALKSKHVHISGWVNDIRENFAKSRVLVAPMQISIGLQNKLLEAMAMKIPCVTSVLANNALGAENNKQILVAEQPEEYVKHILFLLDNPDKAAEISENAYDFVHKKFNWEQSTKQLEKLIIS